MENSKAIIPSDSIAAPMPPLAVTEQEAIAMLSLNKGNQSLRAQKANFKRFRDQHKIRALPGFVFSIAAIKRALDKA